MNSTVNVRIPSDMRLWLEEKANDVGLSVSIVVRLIIDQAMEDEVPK